MIGTAGTAEAKGRAKGRFPTLRHQSPAVAVAAVLLRIGMKARSAIVRGGSAASILALGAVALAGAAQADGSPALDTYGNPLPLVSASLGKVENCSDPDVLEGPEGDPYWYLLLHRRPAACR